MIKDRPAHLLGQDDYNAFGSASATESGRMLSLTRWVFVIWLLSVR
jgi:hypothetical protein